MTSADSDQTPLPVAVGAPAPPEPSRSASSVRTSVAFVAIFAALELSLLAGGMAGKLKPLTDWTAKVSGACIAASGIPSSVFGDRIYLPNNELFISLDCTGVFVAAVFVALVLAYPARWLDKAAGLAAGVPLLFLVNLARLIGAGWVAETWPSAFHIVHDLVFQAGMIGASVLLWAVWLSRVSPNAR